MNWFNFLKREPDIASISYDESTFYQASSFCDIIDLMSISRVDL